MLNPRHALAKLGAQIKASVLVGLDKLQRSQATAAIRDMKVAIHEMIANKRTPGAFGSAMPRRRQRRAKWARANAAACHGHRETYAE